MEPLVSIIIPTYNRANLIGETLDSVLAQTYTNWECIVVDDGSNDNTDEVLKTYCDNDARFKYVHRPNAHKPGGNGARNYGFELSKGDYIQWFDSDDLMHPEKLERKVNLGIETDADFVISKTKYFNKPDEDIYNYDYTEDEVNFLSYSTTHISWFTPDMFIKRKIAENVKFNEELKAGQEYNFACKLLLISNNLKKLDDFLTLRRFHDDSIGSKRRSIKTQYLKTKFLSHWITYLDVNNIATNQKFNKYSLLYCISCYLQSHNNIELPKRFNKELRKVFGFKYLLFFGAKWTNNFFGRYHYFYSKMRR